VHLSAAMIPPQSALDELAALVRSVGADELQFGLTGIARQVPTAVEQLGFFVDRRGFRPWVAVGNVTATTTPPFLTRLVETLGS